MKSTRQELEQYVVAWNIHLKEVIHTMDYVTLLRNCNPAHRGTFAGILMNDKIISKNQAKEFIKIVGE